MPQPKPLVNPPSVLVRPHVSEKATALAAGSVYVFRVSPRANKHSVARAFEATYKIRPRKVNLVNLPAKKIWHRGRPGRRPSRRQALVFLSPGQKIELT